MRRARAPRWPAVVACGLAALAMLAAAAPASACAVCYGDPESPMAIGMNNGILTLLGFVGVVQIGFVALFWSFRRRARRLDERRERFRVIEGGVNR